MRFFISCFMALLLAASMAQAAPLALTVNPARDDVFIPTSAWLVGPSSPAPAAPPAPCVMANQFDNGFLLRFSGGNKRLLAMALDVHQQAFTAGQPYLISLSVGDKPPKSISAQAYDSATLLVDLRGAAEAYGAIRDGRILHVIVAGKTLDFALLGMADGMNRLEACYGGDQSVMADRPPPIALSSDGVDPNYRSALSDTAMAQTAPTETTNDPAESLGMHTLVTSRPPTGTAQVTAQPKATETAATPADGGSPQGLIDQMLQKAANGLRGLSGGARGGMQDAMTPQAPKSATITLSTTPSMTGRPLNGDETVQPETVTPASGAVTPSVQTVNGPLAGNWTSSAVRRDSQGRDVIDGANRSVPFAQDAQAAPVQAAPFHQPGGQNLGPDAQTRLQTLNYALPQ